MKPYTLALAFLLLSTLTRAQSLGRYYHQYYGLVKESDPDPLPPTAYNRFVADNFSFTILGATSPTTGIKIETEKPSVTLRGSIYKKGTRFISTFELTGGAETNLSSIFSGDKVSSVFKANLEGHILVSKNPSTYISQAPGIIGVYRTLGKKRYSELLDEEYKSVIITTLLNKDFQSSSSLEKLKKTVFEEIVVKPNRKSFFTIKNKSHEYEGAENIYDKDKKEPERFERITTKLLEEYGSKRIDSAFVLNDYHLGCFVKLWKGPNADSCEFAPNKSYEESQMQLVKTYRESVTKSANSLDSLFDTQIKSVNHIWSRKVIRWISVGFTPTANNFMLYNPADSSLTDNSKVLLGGKVAFNYYRKFKEPTRFLYVTSGISIREMNNLDELEDYSYKKTKSIKIINPEDPTETETIVKEETGISYEGTYKRKLGIEAYSELFLGIWKASGAPGFYAKAQYIHGKQWINSSRLGGSIGLMWSVSNKDKDKANLLTIIPYVKWSNFLDEYNDEARTAKKALHENFSIGISLGIPINIGK